MKEISEFMTERVLFMLLIAIAGCGVCFAQVSGNRAYSQSGGKAAAKHNERSKRPQEREAPPQTVILTPAGQADASMFIEASVLMNLKADEYVAVFGAMQECAAAPECNQKMDATINQFAEELKRLGISSQDIHVDFATQNRIYAHQMSGIIARESPTDSN